MRGASLPRFLLLAVLASAWTSGCRACSSRPSRDKAPAQVVKKVAARNYQRSPKLQNLMATPTAVVLRSGSRAWAWVDGRSSALSLAVDTVRWSPAGFEYVSSSGFTKVLAPGGSLYYRLGTAPSEGSKPLTTIFGQPSVPPDGFGIDYIDGAGGARVQAILTGPEGRRVRLGLFQRVPDEQVWLRGELRIDGQISQELGPSVRFKKDADGRLLNEIPDRSEPLEWQPVSSDDLKLWAEALQAFSKDGSALTVGSATAADLDRDGALESIVCLDGPIRMLAPRCVLVEEVDEETRIHGLSLPWTTGGPSPLAFTIDGAPYAMLVSSEDGMRVLRTHGAGWVVDAIP